MKVQHCTSCLMTFQKFLGIKSVFLRSEWYQFIPCDVWIYLSVYTHWNIPAERNIMAVYAPLEHIQTSNCAGGSAVRAAGQPAVWSACVLAGKIWQKNGHDMIWSWGAWSVCLYQKHEGQNACAFINMLCFRLEMKTLKHSFTSKYTKILYY